MKDKYTYGPLAGGGLKGFPASTIELFKYNEISHENTRTFKVQSVANQAKDCIDKNKECFIAQWILQNPNKNVDDYVLCYLNSFTDEGQAIVKVWLEKKREV